MALINQTHLNLTRMSHEELVNARGFAEVRITHALEAMESLEQQLEHLQCYFEQGCTVYHHARTITEKVDILAEIDRTLDEANEIRRQLGATSIEAV